MLHPSRLDWRGIQAAALWLAIIICTLFAATGFQFGSSFIAYFGLFFAMGALLRTYPYLSKPLVTMLFCTVTLALMPIHQTKLGLAFIVPPLAIAVGRQSWPVLRSAGRFGDLSYGIYIYAWPVQQIAVALMGANRSYFALLGVSLPITVALAFFSWHVVEKAALRHKPASPREKVDTDIKAAC